MIGEVPGIKEDQTPEPVTLRPNRFRPKAGTREQLRSILHETLEEEATTVAKDRYIKKMKYSRVDLRGFLGLA